MLPFLEGSLQSLQRPQLERIPQRFRFLDRQGNQGTPNCLAVDRLAPWPWLILQSGYATFIEPLDPGWTDDRAAEARFQSGV